MSWKKSKPLIPRVMQHLINNDEHKCRHCGVELKLGEEYMINKHNNRYGLKSKWYHLDCYDRMFIT